MWSNEKNTNISEPGTQPHYNVDPYMVSTQTAEVGCKMKWGFCEVEEVHFFKGDGSWLSEESQRDLGTQKTISLTSYHHPLRYYYFKTEEIKVQ